MTSSDYPTQSESGQVTQAPVADGLILCGGRGSRVGGADKGLLAIGGEAAVTRAVRLLQPLCAQLYISANRNLERYRELAPGPVLRDLRADYPGPVAALEAVAGVVRSHSLLILPVDMPELSPEVPAELLRCLLNHPDRDVVYARTEDREHYLCAALRCDSLPAAGRTLDRNQHAVRDMYATLHCSSVLFTGDVAQGFRNRNASLDWPDTSGAPPR